MSTGASLAIDVLRELDVIAGIDVPDAADQTYVLGLINRVLDDWSAEYGPAYAVAITSHTLTPALALHSIGPSGATFIVGQRPVSIDQIVLVSGTTRTALAQWTMDEWMRVPDQTTSGTPFAFAYNPTFPSGEILFYLVPSSADTVEVQSRVLLAQLSLTTVALLPPGYRSALVLTVSEQAAAHFHAAPRNPMAASKARGRIAAANAKTPRLHTDAPGVSRGEKDAFGSGYGRGAIPSWIDEGFV